MNSTPPDGVIRITKDEALSSHVDDMLKRQMSLRGQPGVSRDDRRQWYYQNWLIFMLVGLIGAIAAWAIIEPVFDDMHYFQGEITEFDPEDRSLQVPDQPPDEFEPIATHGSITIKGEKIYLLRSMREISPDGTRRRLDARTVAPGKTLGLYINYERGEEFDLALAAFAVFDPPPQPAETARLTLDQLESRSEAAGFVLFSVVAGMIGLVIGAADGLVCRLPRRALLCGLVGLLVGSVGGLISSVLASIAYAPLTMLATQQSSSSSGLFSTFGFAVQLVGRSLAWGLAGLAMGLGQGIALRSSRLLLYGLIGGVIGGLLGGLLFDPIDLILLSGDKPSSHWSRFIGLAVIGASVGAMIGVVELLARDAWLRMTQGPLAGKEFLIFKDVMNIGSSPRSDIYLFNDPLVSDHHAVIRAMGEDCEIEARQTQQPVLINDRSVTRARLRHGDSVTIGRTVFVFQQRKG